jgi:anti-sigma factor RsiW
MSCDRVQELLAAYTENELSAADKAMVEGHCLACAECAGLLALLREADRALASFPEVEPGPALLERLYEIPARKRRPHLSFGFFLKPSLQPVFAAATVALTLFSLYFINPDRRAFDKAVSRQFHRGVGQVERLYARAGAVTDTLGGYADTIFATLKAINPLGRDKE